MLLEHLNINIGSELQQRKKAMMKQDYGIQVIFNQTSLKWLTVAMPLLENSKRQERQD